MKLDAMREFDKLAIVGFSQATQESVFDAFELTHKEARGVRVLYACYAQESYQGRAMVLFDKDDKLYEVNASHCSCYGLANQWEPEEVNKIELLKRFDTDNDLLGENREESWGNALDLDWCKAVYMYLAVIIGLEEGGYAMTSRQPTTQDELDKQVEILEGAGFKKPQQEPMIADEVAKELFEDSMVKELFDPSFPGRIFEIKGFPKKED